jgi:hypothetical protein
MTRLGRTILLIALASCLVAVGCGSDDEGEPIPASIATQLQDRLDEIERRFEFGNGACGDIQNDSLPAVEDLIDSIPENVGADVRDALADGFDRLFVLSREQCQESSSGETDTETVTETAPPVTDTATETVPPETTETVPPPTEPTETAEPPATETAPATGGDTSGGGGQGGDATGGEGGGAIVPEDQG